MDIARQLRTGLVLALIVAATTAGGGCASRVVTVPAGPPPSSDGWSAPDAGGARSVAHATEPASGGHGHKVASSLPVPVAPRVLGEGIARITWTTPSKLDYGSEAATDPVAGYRIYAGQRPDALQLEAQVADPRATHYVMRRLPKGQYWFTVTSYTRLGIESDRPPPVAMLVR